MSEEEALSDRLEAVRAATGKRFWRGLEELLDLPGFREKLAREFPSLAGEGDWRRRDILKCLGGALALAGLDGCERLPDEDAQPAVVQQEGEEPGIARYYATAVELDGVAQPVIGKTRMARPIKLEGNADHPACQGATDAFTQAALLDLYDPERSAAPLFKGGIADWARFDAAMAEQRGQMNRTGGEGVRLLTGPVGSPSLLRQIGLFLGRYPKARWYSVSQVAAPPLGERMHLDRAHVVVAFDDDPIGPGPRQTFHASGWASRRRAYQGGDGAAALFVAEPSPSLTGVAATDRLVAREDRMAALLLALAGTLAVTKGPMPRLTSREADWVAKVAAALREARGKGLVSVGAHHPTELRQLAMRIDAALGNLGATRSSSASGTEPHSVRELMAEMPSGAVRTLFILDTNPVYGLPGFGEALVHVPRRIHAGLHADETAALCHWHVPLAHALESWSDGRAADGSAVLVQPLVQPWLPVRSRHRLLAAWTGEEGQDRDLIRATWPALTDERWQQALLRGIVPDSIAVTSVPPIADARLPEASHAPGLTVMIRPDPCVWDGRFASNPWLQELPKPLTKISWGTAIHVSPALARERDLANGDLVRLSVGRRSVTGPVWIMPGQERQTILLHLGHGRDRGGRVARGVGIDVSPLVGATGSVEIVRVDGQEAIASTQTHFAMEGEEFVRFVATAADKLPKAPPPESFFPAQKSSPAWGMAIDLDLCIGCNACVVACVAENNIPMVGREQVAKGREMHWLRIDRYQMGSPDEPRNAFQPVPCMHCEDAPCEMGCPVNATVHSPDGLNLQVYNRCIGTRTCSAYCPYKVRRFNWFDLTGGDPPELRAARNLEVTVRSRGVMEKCTYCIQRISAARIAAKKEDRPIREGEIVTACQAACPTQAIIFGDISDKGSTVSHRKNNGRDYDLLPDANTRPRTTYQARIDGGGKSA